MANLLDISLPESESVFAGGDSERQRVDALLLEGLESGDPVPVNAEYWAALREELGWRREGSDR